jgi:hypothetical protein
MRAGKGVHSPRRDNLAGEITKAETSQLHFGAALLLEWQSGLTERPRGLVKRAAFRCQKARYREATRGRPVTHQRDGGHEILVIATQARENDHKARSSHSRIPPHRSLWASRPACSPSQDGIRAGPACSPPPCRQSAAGWHTRRAHSATDGGDASSRRSPGGPTRQAMRQWQAVRTISCRSPSLFLHNRNAFQC